MLCSAVQLQRQRYFQGPFYLNRPDKTSLDILIYFVYPYQDASLNTSGPSRESFSLPCALCDLTLPVLYCSLQPSQGIPYIPSPCCRRPASQTETQQTVYATLPLLPPMPKIGIINENKITRRRRIGVSDKRRHQLANKMRV